ncbi:sensor histidine kinase [Pedobacter cryoconitis]|uniref:Sensor histidine kinase YesM n=1 Tax=Pedobacter cryoconitis TaxID=188932 RepID=A0A7X0J5D8_9SPHI|nr:histidine kinase [Pedobacter cryoconitis]MBB6500142.1 sensor histidine kinase YesM [Pedobacter cryoconitis]
MLRMITSSIRPFIDYFLFYSLNIALFYFHSLILLRKGSTKTKKDIWLIPALIIIELLVYYFISIFIIICLKEFAQNHVESITYTKLSVYFTLTTFAGTVWRGVYFALYGSAYYVLISYYQKKQNELNRTIENEQLKNELLRAEQDFLRAQINPHLLFNTLSFIKYAAKKKPEEANEAIMRLSGIMGFALENNSQTILVTKELEQVENIIRLNQLRFNHTLYIEYTTKLKNDQVTIIPIILLTLVENVFKHGNLLDKDYPAEIRVESTDEYLILQTSNLPNHDGNIISGKTGLANINSRLKQFYKENYQFSHGMMANLFRVEIKIKLNN